MEFFTALDEGRFDDAEKLLEESYAILDKEDFVGLFWINNSAIYLAVKQGNIDKARTLGQDNLRLAKDKEDLELVHVALHQLAFVEREDKNYVFALEYIEKEKAILVQLDLAESELILAKSVTGYEFAYLHYLLGEKIIAEKEMKLALELALQTGDVVAQACASRGLGEILSDVAYFEKAKALFMEIDDQVGAKEVDELIKGLG